MRNKELNVSSSFTDNLQPTHLTYYSKPIYLVIYKYIYIYIYIYIIYILYICKYIHICYIYIYIYISRFQFRIGKTTINLQLKLSRFQDHQVNEYSLLQEYS